MTPDDIDSIDDITAYIDQVIAEDDRNFRAEREREAEQRRSADAPVRKSAPQELLYREHENIAPARALVVHRAPADDEEEPPADPLIDAIGAVISDERWRERREVREALAPLQREIAAMREELAELRGFRDGLVGRDVPTAWFKLRGEFNEQHVYSRLDIVSRDGAWWIARHDDPGPIGGDGWREGPRARQGERGLRGATGPRGPQGKDAPKFVSWDVDRANYRAIAKMSDGSEMPPLELRGLFEQFLSEVERRG